tara:strand:- start:45389 stop:46018 length:630 start_codon:yes stop_codon:yes gene_type:complete
MVNEIFNYFISEDFFKILITSLLGFTYQQTLIFNNQSWVKSKFQTLNFLLLPPIGFAITSSISSSIALSLGMVGALSIIRFRTPVKNSFELVSYFLLLSIGVITTVNVYTSLGITIFSCIVIVVITFFESKKLFYNSSLKPHLLSESSNYLTVTMSKNYEFDIDHVVTFSFAEEKYYYTLTGTKEYLLNIKNSLIGQNEIIEITANFDS